MRERERRRGGRKGNRFNVWSNFSRRGRKKKIAVSE